MVADGHPANDPGDLDADPPVHPASGTNLESTRLSTLPRSDVHNSPIKCDKCLLIRLIDTLLNFRCETRNPELCNLFEDQK